MSGDKNRDMMTVRSICVILIVLLFAVNSIAQMGFMIYPSENQVKAKYLYNFARFVDWPDEVFPDDKTPITIGVICEDPFGIDLNKTVEGKRINGREFRIKRFDQLEHMEYCHILFIGSCSRDVRYRILNELKVMPVLTVGDADRFASDGGMINFIEVDEDIRFEINNEAVKRSGLVLSPRILKMATIVEENRSESGG